MIDIRRHKRGTITIRPVLETLQQRQFRRALDYYRRKALAEMCSPAVVADLERSILSAPDPALKTGRGLGEFVQGRVSNVCRVWR